MTEFCPGEVRCDRGEAQCRTKDFEIVAGTDKDQEMFDEMLLHEVHGELDAKVQSMLGHALKAHYDDLICSPVPARFLVLLAELEAKELRERH